MVESDYKSPEIGYEVSFDLLGSNPDLIKNEKSLKDIIVPALTLDNPVFTIIDEAYLTHRYRKGGFIVNVPLSESHLAIYVSPGGEVHGNIYSCLGNRHGALACDDIIKKLQPQYVSRNEMPIVVGENSLKNIENLVEFNESTKLDNQISAVFFGCDSVLLNDYDKLAQIYTNIVKKKALDSLKIKTHPFAPQGMSGVSVGDGTYSAIHTYPEHGSLYIRLCDLDGITLEEEFKEFREAIKHRKIIIPFFESFKEAA